MSQHLITEFINRACIFKPLSGGKIANHRVAKYQGSNRKNNISPAIIAQSLHVRQKGTPKKDKTEASFESSGDKHIDVVV